ncbi:MAG: hypothetical protein HQL26_09750 [Candidatus Omnitrophica bacterium]|nr:hypothetical protein [Candidatus Omnitrophota bacterium]
MEQPAEYGPKRKEEPCPFCDGTGMWLVSKEEILGRIRKKAETIDSLSYFQKAERGDKFRQCIAIYRQWKRDDGYFRRHREICPYCSSNYLYEPCNKYIPDKEEEDYENNRRAE